MSKGGPKVSHLFFADDLLLFGEATMQQTGVMYEILDTFYRESGEKVNSMKFKIWYSPNTINRVSNHSKNFW